MLWIAGQRVCGFWIAGQWELDGGRDVCSHYIKCLYCNFFSSTFILDKLVYVSNITNFNFNHWRLKSALKPVLNFCWHDSEKALATFIFLIFTCFTWDNGFMTIYMVDSCQMRLGGRYFKINFQAGRFISSLLLKVLWGLLSPHTYTHTHTQSSLSFYCKILGRLVNHIKILFNIIWTLMLHLLLEYNHMWTLIWIWLLIMANVCGCLQMVSSISPHRKQQGGFLKCKRVITSWSNCFSSRADTLSNTTLKAGGVILLDVIIIIIIANLLMALHDAMNVITSQM